MVGADVGRRAGAVRPGRERDPDRAGREPAVALDELLRGSVINACSARRAPIDVHVISSDADDDDAGPRVGRGRRRPRRRGRRRDAASSAWPLAIAGSAAARPSSSSNLRDTLDAPERPAALPARWSSWSRRVGGFVARVRRRVAGSCSRTGTSRRRSQFTIAEGENLLALVVFLVVGGRGEPARGHRVAAAPPTPHRRGAEAETLAALSGTLVGRRGSAAAAGRASSRSRSTPSASRCSRERDPTTSWTVEAAAGDAGARRPRTTPTSRVPLGDARACWCSSGATLARRRPRGAPGVRGPARGRRRAARAAGRRGARRRASPRRTSCAPRCSRAVSHDLRTPLASIKASVTSLLQRDVDLTPDGDPASCSRRSTRRPTGSTASSATCST